MEEDFIPPLNPGVYTGVVEIKELKPSRVRPGVEFWFLTVKLDNGRRTIVTRIKEHPFWTEPYIGEHLTLQMGYEVYDLRTIFRPLQWWFNPYGNPDGG